jgi:hypothetical protein
MVQMMILKMPYAEKDQAKALRARWNNDRKTRYVAHGQPSAPFEKWLIRPLGGQAPSNAGVAKENRPKVDSYSGAPVVGEHYVKLEHDCNPYVECAECLPLLQRTGWATAHADARKSLEKIQPSENP